MRISATNIRSTTNPATNIQYGLTSISNWVRHYLTAGGFRPDLPTALDEFRPDLPTALGGFHRVLATALDGLQSNAAIP